MGWALPRDGGLPILRAMRLCVSFSYSTEVLRGTAARRCAPAAQASVGFMIPLADELVVVLWERLALVLKLRVCALELPVALALES